MLGLIVAASSGTAGWIPYHYPKQSAHPGMESILCRRDPSKGVGTFSEAINQLVERGSIHRLKTITIHVFLDEGTFQEELMKFMQRRDSKLLKEAIILPNHSRQRKVDGLYKHFIESILDTTAVKKIASHLAKHNLRIAQASGEKFRLLTTGAHHQFRSSLVLIIERMVEQTASGERPRDTRP